MTLSKQLMKHEGLRLKPYTDSVGKLTIGIGRNLDDVGISKQEALAMLTHDIDTARNELLTHYPSFEQLSPTRMDACINMVFNMGIARFSGFKRFIKALLDHDYELAAIEMLDSKWARQVGYRATELANQVRTNTRLAA